jgi:arginine utilization protein RocB
MSTIRTDRIAQAAKHAVSHVLLFRFHKNGGSINPEYDIKRAHRVVEEELSAEDLLDLLHEVAERTAEDASQQVQWVLRDLLEEAEKMAVRTDSLTFFRYVDRLRERIEEMEPETETVTTADGTSIDVPTGPTPLDPFPWECFGKRYREWAAIPFVSGYSPHWNPRPEYEQDRTRYGQ